MSWYAWMAMPSCLRLFEHWAQHRLAGRLNGWKKQADQDRDDRDRDQKLDEREAFRNGLSWHTTLQCPRRFEQPAMAAPGSRDRTRGPAPAHQGKSRGLVALVIQFASAPTAVSSEGAMRRT